MQWETGLQPLLVRRAQPLAALPHAPTAHADLTHLLTPYSGCELTPNIALFGYEEAAREAADLARACPSFGGRFWPVGRSGQGDGWLLDRESGAVAFYDHDAGEPDDSSETLGLGVGFGEFLRVARVLADLEAALDAGDLSPEAEAQAEVQFRARVDAVRAGLWEAWPYGYF